MQKILLLLINTALMFTTSCKTTNSDLILTESDEGIGISEKGKPVLFYQKMPRSLTGQYICNNYIHPLYDLNGDTITEEFPADHHFHRGVFWAWHQLMINELNLGDGWINEGISQEVAGLEAGIQGNTANIVAKVMWNSPAVPEGQPFIEELTTVTVYRKEKESRTIDFEIILKPLIEGLKIGGSADEKGYGGFSVRMKLPEDITFNSAAGPVEPQNLQISAGPEMDFSGTFGSNGRTGILLLCHKDNPGYPTPWILRRKGSMQNAAFPGRELYSVGKPLVLKYRLVLHNGDISGTDIRGFRNDYDK